MLFIVKQGNRKRYIGFIVKSKDEIDKKDLIDKINNESIKLSLKNSKNKDFFLISFNDFKGILRCKHTEKDNAINLLNSIKTIKSKKVEIKTVGTSGTIKALKNKYFT